MKQNEEKQNKELEKNKRPRRMDNTDTQLTMGT